MFDGKATRFSAYPSKSPFGWFSAGSGSTTVALLWRQGSWSQRRHQLLVILWGEEEEKENRFR